MIWEPSRELIASCGLTRFLGFLEDTRGLRFDAYLDFWRWSVADIDEFWGAVFTYEDVLHDGDPSIVLAEQRMPGARWFPDVRLNYAEHLLRRRGGSEAALVVEDEDGAIEETSWAELERQAGALAATLRHLGVGRGDRVVALLPNCAEPVIGLIACASIGAIWSVCSPEYGLPGIVSRFRQLDPKVLIAVDGYRFGGRAHDRRETVDGLLDALPTLEHLLWAPLLTPDSPPPVGVPSTLWTDATAGDAPLTFARVPFDHPLWVLFSSGTTGIPKGIVHGHGGMLLDHLRAASLHFDARRGELALSVATTSWMVWNVHVSNLLAGASLLLLAGNAAAPLDRVWRAAAEHRAARVNVGSGYVLACMNADLRLEEELDFSSLTQVGAAGSPLPADGYRWVAEQIGERIWQSSGSGGTDVCAAFVSGVPTLPVRAGRMQVPCAGVAVEAWDEAAQPVAPGVLGELVITRPLPSMPLFLWGDVDRRRLTDTYYSHFPGVWRQGDYIEFDIDGSCTIPGRSDSTLNRRGIRIGPAEIYSVVERLPEVDEALVVGAELGGDYYMPLFIAATDGVDEEDLRARIVTAIRDALSPRHVPDEIVFVPAIPHTKTGKKLEVPVKRLLQGVAPAEAADPGSVDRPELLDLFADLIGRPSAAGLRR
ncbi:MAG TPA: acetoacetate--CoA ligase [Solirubrobacteraceae bacterium]|nr:acetoacetate--CoA ligase [Solirubrobacteraceae bacterium]